MSARLSRIAGRGSCPRYSGGWTGADTPEALIATVYNTLRAAPTWPHTLLLILYDEHGGCFDHASPPPAVPPPGPYPDGFRFDRYGVRIPAVVVSPYIPAGSVIRPSGPYPFDHCSVQSTLHKLFEIGQPLSPRVAAAPDVLSALTLSEPGNPGPERVEAQAPARRIEDIRAYRRRARNHHQAALLGPGHVLPALLAHVSARTKSALARRK